MAVFAANIFIRSKQYYPKTSRMNISIKHSRLYSSKQSIDETMTVKDAIFSKKGALAFVMITTPLLYYYIYLYPRISKYPSNARSYLRDAIHAKNMKRFDLSEVYFKIALDRLDSKGLDKSSKEYTGVLISLAEVYEANNKLELAISNYENIVVHIGENEIDKLPNDKKLRLSQTYVKLMDMYLETKNYEKSDENINKALNMVLIPDKLKGLINKQPDVRLDNLLDGLQNEDIVPDWIPKEELISLLERSAEYFRNRKVYNYAIPLYNYNINYIVKDPCNISILLCNLATVYQEMKQVPTSINLLNTSLKIVDDHISIPTCRDAKAGIMFNLGFSIEMLNEKDKARAIYNQILDDKSGTVDYKNLTIVRNRLDSIK